MVLNTKKINQELLLIRKEYTDHLKNCDVFEKGSVLISFYLMLKYVYYFSKNKISSNNK